MIDEPIVRSMNRNDENDEVVNDGNPIIFMIKLKCLYVRLAGGELINHSEQTYTRPDIHV